MNENKPRKHRLNLLLVALLVSTWTPAALAFTANLVTSVHLRAGPSIAYPGVTMLPAGAVVQVFGCEQNYGWCDVQLGPNRGWVDAAYLQAQSPGGTVIVANSGVMLGIPIVSFGFGTYWDSYYRGQPWYTRRAYYLGYWNRYPHGRPPPPPHRPIVRPPAPPPSTVRPPPHPRPPGSGRPPPGGSKPRRDNGSGQPSTNPRPALGSSQQRE
jgi:uncharacterized protein YraI